MDRPFRFRLNCIDHYQATPTAFDPQLHGRSGPSQQKSAPTVPVIRVFGATETGQKVCAHIHGVLPYLYLEYDGSLAKNDVEAYIQTLRVSIDHALAVSYRRNIYDGKAAFVGHITLVKGVPFYGYHVGYKFFLKVYMLNPLHMTRFADLLQQGAIMKKVFQPYESHLQYILQWMCDYNLYGCAYIDCARVKFRSPIQDYLELTSLAHQWHDSSIDPSLVSDPDEFPRQSHCSIEVDVCVRDILNRTEIRPRPLHHDFVERFSHLAPDEKFVHSMAGLWRDETRRRRKHMGITDPSSSPFPPDVLISMSADPRNTEKGGWIHEDEYREMVDGLIRDEGRKNGSSNVGFDNFVRPILLEDEVKTALESVEDLFPENLEEASLRQGAEPEQPCRNSNDEPPVVLVDEASIPKDDMIDESYHSDEDTAKEMATTQAKLESGRLEERHQAGSVVSIEHNDEHCPDEEVYGQQFQDPADPIEPFVAAADPSLETLSGDSEDEFGSFDAEAVSFLEDHAMASPRARAKRPAAPLDHRTPKRQKLSNGHVPSPLRYAHQAPVTSGSTGRLDYPEASKQVAFDQLDNSKPKRTPTPSPRKSAINDLPRLSQSSQGSIKAFGTRGPNTLSFPTVKNPNDPDTALRLSQRSEYSNSQKSPKTPAITKTASLSASKDSPQTPWTHQKSTSTSFSQEGSTVSAEGRKVAAELAMAFGHASSCTTLCYGHLPPSAELVSSTMLEHGLPPVIYQEAYYSDEKDVPDRPREYAGREFKLESTTVPYLPPFDPTATAPANFGQKPGVVIDRAKEEALHRRRRMQCTLQNWEFATPPPSVAEVTEWLKHNEQQVAVDPEEVDVPTISQQLRNPAPVSELSQIDGPTQRNKHGFKYSQKQQSTSVQHETQYMSIMSLEVHVNTRGNLVPDPAEDEIACVFWCIQSDDDELQAEGGIQMGVLALSQEAGIAQRISRQVAFDVEHEEDELELINRMVDIVRQFDPDILTGYEVHNGSWGYLIERARLKYEYNLCDEFSRMKSQSHGRFGKEADRWGFTHTSTIRVTGRHMINIWRAMRGELNLLQYTMENVVFHLLHKRIPHYTFADLTQWYKSSKPRDLAKTVDYFLSRVRLNLSILEANELISRTSEQARLLGVDFFSVFSRGSQFKVESLMFRIAKPENFILISPSRKQVGQQNALECLPLVMEPQSAFYNSPLLVLDFQSLYPSVMIAYNYCYSTCLGRIVNWRGQNKLGFINFKRELGLLELLKDHINIAPNGIMYVKPEMRKSLLAKMLGEILETRVMVKSGMKVDRDDKTLQQLLNNRQLALKLIANVTYGYTSASFSGRMPCSEIADSIVQTGRETLEKAIALIHSVERWGAEVAYGDTDSLFVYLKGRTRDEAFTIGNEIAEAVTNTNPRPVKLKFEKVYHPCVLLAKKRYVGFKYESPIQKEPDFDAKGIETVRCDGTPAEQKIEEKALKILFRTADLSEVKRYFQRQCTKIVTGRIGIQDFLFAKEVKLGTYSDKGPPPPGALIATKRMLEDPRTEPQYGERIPYVVITGAPGARLIDRCVAPETLLNDEHCELDAEYYISKNLIPPLERILNLVGANVRQWYDEMPKVQRIRNITSLPRPRSAGGMGGAPLRKTLESYMQSSTCIACRAKLPPPPTAHARANTTANAPPPLPLCDRCSSRPSTALLALRTRLHKSETRAQNIDMVCRSCAGLAFGEEVRCDSRDCPVFYTRVREAAALRGLRSNVGTVIEALEGEDREALDW